MRRKKCTKSVAKRKRSQYWKDPERAKAYQRARYAANKELFKARIKAWEVANKEYIRKIRSIDAMLWTAMHTRPDAIRVAELQARKKRLRDQRIKFKTAKAVLDVIK